MKQGKIVLKPIAKSAPTKSEVPKRKISAWFYTIPSLALLLIALVAYSLFGPSVEINSKDKPALFIGSNQSLVSLEKQLLKLDCMPYPEVFMFWAELLGLPEKIKPGRYTLLQHMSNYELIKRLMNGRQDPLNIVFRGVSRKEDICRFFAANLDLDSANLYDLLNDPKIVEGFGFNTNTIVCMFIPNTYNMYWNTNSAALLNRMHKEYVKFWNPDRIAKALKMGLSPIEVSIIASIVEKESNKEDEKPVIAGVYLNRLRKGMPLQADPTLIFAVNNPEIHRVTQAHIEFESPYNTYLNAGLPPGPICTPGIRSIEAVLNATSHSYYYFCAREDFSGYHAFAESFQQHQQNARCYQRALNKNNIY